MSETVEHPFVMASMGRGIDGRCRVLVDDRPCGRPESEHRSAPAVEAHGRSADRSLCLCGKPWPCAPAVERDRDNYPLDARSDLRLPAPAVGEGKRCYSCDSGTLVKSTETQEFQYGYERPVTLTARVEVERCPKCGYTFTGEQAEEARDAAVREHLASLPAPAMKAEGVEPNVMLKSAVWRAIEDIGTVRCALHSDEAQARELLVDAELRLRAALAFKPEPAPTEVDAAFRLVELERDNGILRAGIAHAEASHRLTADTADERIEQLKAKVAEGIKSLKAAKKACELAEDRADILAARVEAAIVKALDHGDSWMDHRVRESIRDIRCALQGQHVHGYNAPQPELTPSKPADEDEAAVLEFLQRCPPASDMPTYRAALLRFRATAREQEQQKTATVAEHLGRVNRELRTSREQGRQAGREDINAKLAVSWRMGWRDGAAEMREACAAFCDRHPGQADLGDVLRALTLPEPGKEESK